MALRRFMSGIAVAALVAATPMTAHAAPAAPQPKVEQVSEDSSLRGSNRLFGLVAGGLIIAVLLIVLLRRDRANKALPKPVSP